MDPVNHALADIARLGVVPVTTIERTEEAVPIARALDAGGLPCVEVTLRTKAGLAAIGQIRAALPDLLVGAGTILGVDQAIDAVAAGATFLASPGFDDDVVSWCRANEVSILAGVATPTEMMRALRLGLDVVKFFPARASGGPDAISAAAAVFPELRFVPTGGIGPGDVADYVRHPSVLAVGGSWMVARGTIAAGDWPTITRLAADAVEAVRAARKAAT